jgi:hypothetical protein
VLSSGPDGDRFRDPNDGRIKDASDLHLKLGTFTPHRSPLGLVFDNERRLAGDFNGSAFVLSWSASNDPLIAPFNDTSGDLLHVALTKIENEDRYEARVTRIVQGFEHPIDEVLLGNVLYVIENTANAHLWRVTLPEISNSVDARQLHNAEGLRLTCYPNPLRRSATIDYFVPDGSSVRIALHDALGREVRVISSGHVEGGRHTVRLNMDDLSDGVYFCTIQAGGVTTGTSLVIGE